MIARTEIRTEKPHGKPAHLPFYIPIINHAVRTFLRIGVPMGPVALLTVKGRNTGKARRNPVGFFKLNGRQYLFSTFGTVNWVRNLRAARQATVRKGFRSKRVVPVELSQEEAALILKNAVAPAFQGLGGKMFREHMPLKPDAPLSEFISQARQHPVFELVPVGDN